MIITNEKKMAKNLPPSPQLVPEQQQTEVGLVFGQTGRSQLEPLPGVGILGRSELHLGLKKKTFS